jgi:GntR family transcriptional regulator
MAGQNSKDTLSDFLEQWLATENSDAPLFKRLSAGLVEAIQNERLGNTTHLPSERDLSKKLGVSRITVRKSLQELSDSGLIVRRHGAKATIAKRIEKQITRLASFSESMTRRGMKPDMSWISKEITHPSPKEVMELGIPPDDEVVVLDRLRLANERPIAIERAVVPRVFLPSTTLVNGSLYTTLEGRGFRPNRGVQRIYASMMSQAQSELLNCQPGEPMLVIERKCFLNDGRVVEFTETQYNGAMFDFVSEIDI